MKPGIDLVVVAYKSPGDLTRFVDSVQEVLDEIPMSLTIVSVEASEEDEKLALELIQRFPYEECPARSNRLTENVGYARACNAAAQWGDHDTLAFFNADTRLRPGVLKSCHDLLWSDPSIGIVGPKQVDDSNRLTHAGIVGANERPVHRGWMQVDRGQFDDVVDCVTVSGSMYFIKRHLFEQLTHCPTYQAADPGSKGAFLQSHLYHEETWVSVHARHHGYRVLYNGAATAVHRWHGAIGEAGESTHFADSKKLFVHACQVHGIAHN